LNTRVLAAKILVEVTRDGKSFSAALDAALPSVSEASDRAFVQALTYGVLRWYWRLDKVLSLLTRKPIKDERIRMLALLGLFQLKYMHIKPHAAVGETVAAVGLSTWAKPLLNGVLRTYQREHETLEAQIEAHEASALAHPEWLVERLKKDWPDAYRALLTQNNAPPPLTLRVNRLQQSRAKFLDRLAEHGIAAMPSAVCASAATLEQPSPVERIPGFSAGAVSVQDAAAQFAAGLLNLAPGQRVLDLCAAPGGKTAHILETYPELGELVAVDLSGERMIRVRDNLDRIGLSATLITADALVPSSWWDQRPFDRILLDAPCSATGVIRRHPDIKVLRLPADLKELASMQQQILASAWSLLAPGGQLVYATCSVIRAENEANIARFLLEHEDARELPIMTDWGIPLAHGRQILTGTNGMDGFYYARLEKRLPCA
jgi:16S rRNA (cytosine967-C5)-methyltransferase